MITFRVEDLGSDGHRFSVRDEHGRLHVARTAGPTPVLDAGLLGQEAAPGMRVLVDSSSNTPLQVQFEAVNCSQGQALDLLHPLLEPVPSRLRGQLLVGGAGASARRSLPSRPGSATD